MKTNAYKNGQPGSRTRTFTWPSHKAAVVAVVLCLSTVFSAFSAGPLDSGPRTVKTFTANAYIGTDLAPALTVDPSNLSNLLFTTTTLYMQILASDPPARLAGLGQELAASRADIAGLVEMYTLEIAPATVDGPGEFSVVYDYLNLLTNSLNAVGAHYEVGVVSTESVVVLPLLNINSGAVIYGRLIDHEVILYRSDLPAGHLKVNNPQIGQFTYFIQVPGTGLSINRGWCSVDVFTRGEKFRFICTHLEEETLPALQFAQAQELLAGPVNTSLPVLVTGDFNADPLHRNGTVTYDLLVGEGLRDAWTATHPDDPTGGLTWGHDSFLVDPSEAFSWRLDLMLYRGPQWQPTQFVVIDQALDQSTPPLWSSDHAAISTTFRLGNYGRTSGSATGHTH